MTALRGDSLREQSCGYLRYLTKLKSKFEEGITFKCFFFFKGLKHYKRLKQMEKNNNNKWIIEGNEVTGCCVCIRYEISDCTITSGTRRILIKNEF